jgi:hypothetical protein
VFFSGCTLGCVFCQNEPISHHNLGRAMTPIQLCELFERVEGLGVHNLNLVNPTHFAPAIFKALQMRKMQIPVVWNTSGYETVEMVQAARGRIVIMPGSGVNPENAAAIIRETGAGFIHSSARKNRPAEDGWTGWSDASVVREIRNQLDLL